MQTSLNQAAHNQEFHDSIHATFHGKYCDWKNTSLFYVAIHLMKGLAMLRGIDIGSSHQEIEKNVNPDRHGATMRITKGAWIDYKSLFRYSHSARYDGFASPEAFDKIRAVEHKECLHHLQNFKKYVKAQGLPI
jgi:hypothetical protein